MTKDREKGPGEYKVNMMTHYNLRSLTVERETSSGEQIVNNNNRKQTLGHKSLTTDGNADL